MEKEAFNKFNAPELIRQLMTVLEVNGLQDTLVRLKQLRVPEMVNQAWQKREKMASRVASLFAQGGNRNER